MIDTPTPNGRDEHGRFSLGNPGGPGRPRRAVERDYLRALADECPPDTWRRIVRRAVEDAEKGDTAARAWLAKHLLPDPGGARPLLAAAVDEACGVDELAEAVENMRQADALVAALSHP